MSRMKQIEAAAKKLVHFIKETGFRRLIDSAQDNSEAYEKYASLRAGIDAVTDGWKPHEVYENQLQFFEEVVANIDRITAVLHARQPEDKRDAAAAEVERIYREILDYDRLNWFDAMVTLQVRLINVDASKTAVDAIKEALVAGVVNAVERHDAVQGDAENDFGTHEWIEAECEVVPSP